MRTLKNEDIPPCPSHPPYKGHKIFLDNSNRIWTIKDNDDPNSIMVQDHNPRSQGFGGSTLKFNISDFSNLSLNLTSPDPKVREAAQKLIIKLETNKEIALKGPWSSGASNLLNATEYDVTNNYYSFVIVCKKVEYNPTTVFPIRRMIDVVYSDTEWHLGKSGRGEQLGQYYANQINEEVKVVQMYRYGRSCCSYKPIHQDLGEDNA